MKMMKLYAVLLLALCGQITVNAQEVAAQNSVPYYKYRVTLKDKKSNDFSVKHPEAFLSQKALDRRHKQKIKIDETDLPVSQKYLNIIHETGVKIEHTSKWNNTVLVGTSDSTLADKIAELSCVKAVRKVAFYPGESAQPERSKTVMPLDSTKATFQKLVDTIKQLTESNSEPGSMVRRSVNIHVPDTDEYYGAAYTQIKQLNGKALHQSGYKGEGMTIAVIDGGFTNADILPILKNTKILGTKDFVHRKNDFYDTGSHGMMVLSCIGANTPGTIVGTAPEASFWLLLSEDGESEQLVEEDNWAAAIEFADSVGADVINTSLGQNNFDNPADNVHYWELDGYKQLISNSASMCAKKGMILVNSAGNSADEQWKLITSPADAVDVLTVGALTVDEKNTNFSSLGNTADGRIKPDVMALGQEVWLVSPSGQFSPGAGTSFASPIMCGMVACLWQALPKLNAYQIMDIVRKSGNNAEHPDNVYGNGLPDFLKAWEKGLNQ